MRRLSLFIPDLFCFDLSDGKEQLSVLPNIQHFLSRSQCELFETGRYLNLLEKVCAMEKIEVFNAAVSHVADDTPPHDGYWMRADPVNLQADHKGLVLIDNRGFDLNRQEAIALAAEVREALLDLGAELQVPCPERWYLRFSIQPEINTTPVYDVLGKDIQLFLPKGEDSAKWAKVINEVQMIFHESEINHQREARGELPINSLWCWGEGYLPATSNSKFTRIYSDDALIKGFAKHNATVCSELVSNANEVDYMEENINILCVIDDGISLRTYNDFEGWVEWLEQLENDWFKLLLNKFNAGALDMIKLQTNSHEFVYNKWSPYRFWRRTKNIAKFCH